ncbi:MAG TPA: CHAP domain-containing protein [Candidatus Limiplasma sp.]|nr:CHAP domain-containing protein [Candidatus Limiplasma sp.]HRX09883.1 CHAP domain-containing protein [Candidatus Limiplasma sp.]
MPKILVVILTVFVLAFSLAPQPAQAKDALNAQFDEALAAWLSPAEAAMQSASYTLRTGESAYVPAISPGIVPFDQEVPEIDLAGAAFESTDEQIVSVDARGIMTGVAPGVATVICTMADNTYFFGVTVADGAMPEVVKNFIYTAKHEFYLNRRERMPRSNQYTKWYYKSKKEVGWCSVFTIWCANASGFDPIPEEDAKEILPSEPLFLREGQVGNQYDGFSRLGRFVGVPRPGYLVMYANMKNAYLFTHIGIVTDVADLGDGKYLVTTVEGNMSSTVKSYTYLYDSTLDNSHMTSKSREKVQNNISMVPVDQQTDPLTQYETTENFAVFGFCATWQ